MTVSKAFDLLAGAYIEATGQTKEVAKGEVALALATSWANEIGGAGLANVVRSRAARSPVEQSTLPGIEPEPETTKPKDGSK